MALCQGAAVVRGERSGDTMISALIACSRARLSLVVEELGAVVGRGTTWRAAATGGRVDDTKLPPVLVPPLRCQSLHEVGDWLCAVSGDGADAVRFGSVNPWPNGPRALGGGVRGDGTALAVLLTPPAAAACRPLPVPAPAPAPAPAPVALALLVVAGLPQALEAGTCS